MRKLPWKPVITWLLAAFFLAGGLGNIFASETILADYSRWGYPTGFHYLTGFLELSAAALIIVPKSRLAGAVLGCTIMLGAIATLVSHGEFAHAVAPMTVLAFSLTVAFNARQRRSAFVDQK